MSGLTVADIDRWKPGDVREVFQAARSRAEIAQNAADGLATLPAFTSWGGDAADAAKAALDKTRKDLDAHGREALAVARAADQAADGIEKVQADLNKIRNEASSLGLRVNALTSTVEGGWFAKGRRAEVLANIARLQGELNKVLAQANAVDDELAHAINMAGGAEPIPSDSGPPIGPEGLTPTQIASDANEQKLREELTTIQAQVDALQARYDELAVEAYVTGGHGPDNMDELNSLATQLTAAKGQLSELNAVDTALGKAPETYLTHFQAVPGKPVLAAVAVGNPDRVTHVSVTVPGVSSTTKDTLPGMVTEALALQREAELQLHNAGMPGSVATIAWMGYEPPPNPINTLSPRDLWATMTDGEAQAGAVSLSSYLQEVRANNLDGHVTLLGHSYGSLTSSLALQQLHDQGLQAVDDVVFYGSPGLQINSADELGLGPGHAFVMRAEGDPITDWVAPASDLHGWGVDPYSGILPELSSQAGVDPTGVFREGVHGHSGYPQVVSDANQHQQLRMSGYNLAVVTAGLAGQPNTTVLAPPPPVSYEVPGPVLPPPYPLNVGSGNP